MQKKRYTILFHIIGWIAFIGFQFVLFPKPEKLLGNKEALPFIIEQVIVNTICIIFFYVNYYLLLPKFYFNRKFILYILSVLAFVALSIFALRHIQPEKPAANAIPTNERGVPEFSENPLAPPPPVTKIAQPRTLLDEKLLIVGNFFLKFILSFLLSIGFRIYGRWQIAEEEKYKAELSFLKAQINPHFLFNTLNGIYVLAIKKSENTPAAIMRLSSIMRYVISEGHLNYVELEKELKYISDYIDLQKMRLSQTIQVDFLIDAPNMNYKIAPLILMPFIENAFKHGISTEDNCKVFIHISVQNETLVMRVENKKYAIVLKEEEKSGIGIQNTVKRLDVLYPGKYQLDTIDAKAEYIVTLKMQLT